MTLSTVIDASATLAWLYDEQPLSAREHALISEGNLIVPSLWRLEVVNSVLVRERRGVSSSETCS